MTRGVIQMPVQSFGPPDETEDERARREAAAAMEGLAPDALDAPLPPPRPLSGDELYGDRMAAQQADAQRVGDAYRAGGARPAPTSVQRYTQPGHAGSYSVLRFDDPPQQDQPAPTRVQIDPVQMSASPPAAAPIPPTTPRPAAPSMLGRQLAAPGGAAPRPATPADARSPTPGAGQALSSPVDRAALLERLRARDGAAKGGRQPVDHTGADVADAVRRPLHAVGAALQAAGGGRVTPFRSLGDESRERERADQLTATREAQQQSAQRLAQQREERMAADSAAAREGRAEDRAIRMAGVASLDDYRQQMSQIREREAQGLIGQREAAAERIRLQQQRDAAATDPDSPMSAAAREGFEQYRAGLPEQLRSQLGDVDTSRLSAHEIERIQDAYVRHLGTMRHRHASAGTGGGGNPLRRSAPEWSSMTDDEWRALGPTGQRQEIQRHARAGGTEAQGTEILPGVVAPADLEGGEARALRDGIGQAAASAANIRGLADIHQRYGGVRARISRDAAAEITPRLTIASGMVATLGNTGTINEGEVPRINAALPNPADLEQMTFGTFDARMRTWQSLLEETVRGNLASRGVDEAGIRRVIQMIRTGSFARPEARGEGGEQQSDTVRVRLPDGRTGVIPRANLGRAQRLGAEVIDG